MGLLDNKTNETYYTGSQVFFITGVGSNYPGYTYTLPDST